MCCDFEWVQFLHLAEEMKGQPCPAPDDECRDRTITNRAYYAAYHAAEAYISEVDALYFGPNGPTHKDVRLWYQTRPDDGLKQIGRWLIDSFDQRHEADYSSRSRSYSDSSGKAIRWAENIRRAIRERCANANQDGAE